MTLAKRLAEIAEIERQNERQNRAFDAFFRRVTTPGR